MNHNFRLNKKNVISVLILLLCVMISMSAVSAEDNVSNDNFMGTTSQDNLNSVSEDNSALNPISGSDLLSEGSSKTLKSSNDENIKSSGDKTLKSSNDENIKSSGDKTLKSNPSSDKPYIYIASDKIINSSEDKAFMEAIKAEIGDRATVVIDSDSPKSGEVDRAIKNAGKGIAVYISNFCAGTTYGLVQYDMRGYLYDYSQNLDGVCFVYYGTIPVETTDFIARAWDDNFSDPYFAGLYSPYTYMIEGGLGFIQARANGDSKSQMVKTVAEGLLAYAKSANKQHLSYDNITLITQYVAKHDFSPVELAKAANKVLKGKTTSLSILINGKSKKLTLSNWIYYATQYIGAVPIKTTKKTFSLPTTFSASSFTKSFTLSRLNYRTLALKIKNYMDKYGVAPAYITYGKNKININDYCYMLAKIISGHTDKSKFVFANSFTVVKSPVKIITAIPLKKILQASASLKKYITKNKKLPTTIKVNGIKMTLSEYLYLASEATTNVNKKVYSASTYKKFSKKVKATKNKVKGKFSKSRFLNLAKKIVNYMNKNNVAPRSIRVSLGTMQFRTMVYNYACVLTYYKSHKSLPKSVSLDDKKRFK